MNLVTATLKSDNTVYAQLDADLGPDTVAQTARDMGITSPLHGYPAEGLGGLTNGVSPLEMARAYATIANGGYRVKPIVVRKVTFPDGHVDVLGKPTRHKVFEDGVTYEATQILEKNVQAGTGTKAQIGCPAAGKTGTVDNFTDAWFVGFTPRLVSSVWVGHPKDPYPLGPQRAGRRDRRADLGRVHEVGQGQVLRRLPQAEGAVLGPAVLRQVLAHRRQGHGQATSSRGQSTTARQRPGSRASRPAANGQGTGKAAAARSTRPTPTRRRRSRRRTPSSRRATTSPAATPPAADQGGTTAPTPG